MLEFFACLSAGLMAAVVVVVICETIVMIYEEAQGRMCNISLRDLLVLACLISLLVFGVLSTISQIGA